MSTQTSTSGSSSSRPAGATLKLFGFDISPYTQRLPRPAQTLLAVALTAQFGWFLGHASTVWYTLWYIITRNPAFYSRALLGTIVSYGIVLYKSYAATVSATDPAFRARVTRDENLHYVLLAVLWYLSNPLFPLLLPFATFSAFHVLTYARTQLLPGASPALSATLSPHILRLVREYQPAAIRLVAKYEVAVLAPLLVLGVFLRASSLVQPVMFAQFLRLRFVFSPTTKQATREVRAALDRALGGFPVYVQAVGYLERLLESIMPDAAGADPRRAQ